MQEIPAGIISADGHVCEPANCYIDYIEPKYRDRRAAPSWNNRMVRTPLSSTA